MTLSNRLRRFLQDEAADYRLLSHADAYAAQRVAAAVHVPGRQMAKPVVVRDAGGELMMVVLPATERLHLPTLALAVGHASLSLVDERELTDLFPDCEVGAVPPFGSLYGLPVYVDSCLREQPELFFQGGDHREVVAMRWPEFERLCRPVVGQICFHEPHRKVA